METQAVVDIAGLGSLESVTGESTSTANHHLS